MKRTLVTLIKISILGAMVMRYWGKIITLNKKKIKLATKQEIFFSQCIPPAKMRMETNTIKENKNKDW